MQEQRAINKKEINPQEVIDILKSGDFQKFIGVRENEVFEAKSVKPYDLDSDDGGRKTHAIAELSTDIASFANQAGGFIVCGLDTSNMEDTPHDIVQSTDLMRREDFYKQDDIGKFIKTSIHPSIEVEVKWYHSAEDADLGLGAIYIPRQDEDKKHFIVRVCESDGLKFKGFFGIPIRKDDQRDWLPLDEIYRLTKRKPSKIQELHQSLTDEIDLLGISLSQKIDRLTNVSGLERTDPLQLKIDKAIEEKDYRAPFYILAATPQESVRFEKFLDVDDQSPKLLLQRPPYSRYYGWNMLTGDYAGIREGSYWEVRNGDRKLIQMHRDGSLLTVVHADNSFLGFGRTQDEFMSDPKLSALALIEYTYDFVEFYRNLLERIEPVKHVIFRVALKNTELSNGKMLCLVAQSLGIPFLHQQPVGAVEGNFSQDITVDLENGSYDSRYVAFLLFREAFIRFGASPETIPYTADDENGKKYIDPGQFPKA